MKYYHLALILPIPDAKQDTDHNRRDAAAKIIARALGMLDDQAALAV